MITLATIEQQTREYAAVRWAMLEAFNALQNKLEAVRKQHESKLKRRVKAMTEAHEALWAQIEAHPELFPEGAKSIAVNGIKVGYQKGKTKLEVINDNRTIEVLRAWIVDAEMNNALELKQAFESALKITYKLVDASLKKLPSELHSQLGIAHIPAADSVLVMPQDDDTTKAVDALIKAMQSEIADGE